MKKIFIDESGDLGKKGSKYFLITALIINDEKPFDRLIKNIRRNKFKKQLKKAIELKASDSSIELINYLLNKLSKLDFYCVSVVILKEKNFSSYLTNNNHKLYNFVSGKLALNLELIKNEKNLEIYIDKSKRKSDLRKDFDQYFNNNLRQSGINAKSIIKHSYSHNFNCLQIVDFISWAIFQKFEYANDELVNKLSSKLEIHQIWK